MLAYDIASSTEQPQLTYVVVNLRLSHIIALSDDASLKKPRLLSLLLALNSQFVLQLSQIHPKIDRGWILPDLMTWPDFGLIRARG